MALVTLPASLEVHTLGYALDGSGVAVNATGEYSGMVGYLRLRAGTGTKTLSAAGGGYIVWEATSGSITDGGSDFRVGIQDVDASGFGDGTYDVYGALTGAISAGANKTVMTSGSKSMSHGDLYCFLVTAVVQAGGDTVTPDRSQSIWQLRAQSACPYGVNNTGTPAKNENFVLSTIVFDDGTYGWIEGYPYLQEQNAAHSTFSINTGTTPDEIAAIIQLPFTCAVDGVGWIVDNIAAADDWEFVIYGDPEGTPVALATSAIDPDLYTSTGQMSVHKIARTTLTANTSYGIAVRPTTANSISVAYLTLPSVAGVAAAMKGGQPFTVCKTAGRSNQTGAFVETNAVDLPLVLLQIAQLDDGTGSSGASAGAWMG